jgi:hypothetical protein
VDGVLRGRVLQTTPSDGALAGWTGRASPASGSPEFLRRVRRSIARVCLAFTLALLTSLAIRASPQTASWGTTEAASVGSLPAGLRFVTAQCHN